jgi:hypothetical protein
MPIFTAAAAYIAATIGVSSVVGLAAINFGVRVLASYVVSTLIGNRSNTSGNDTSAANNLGNRVQFPPATDNKLPVVYGTAFVSPAITDAVISTDLTTMWYVMALSEKTDSGTFSFGRQWWGDKELILDSVDKTKVIKWIDSSGTENTNISGKMYIYYYNNGSNNPTNTTQTAIEVLSDAAISTPNRWTSNHLMSNTAFAIIKIIYNQDASTTGLEQFKVQLQNSLTSPGAVIGDYLVNSRYGCGVGTDHIDAAALANLDTYSNQLITYTPVGGGTATQARYTINGPLNTNNACLTNLQQLVDTCDSWLKWDEVNGRWSVVINRSYLDYTTYANLFVIDSSNIIGGVDVNPVDLNSSYNSIEGQFPNSKIKDQTDYTYVLLPAADMSPNEPANRLVLQFPLINNSVQATYLSTRRLIQSREDLIINFTMDYSGIQIEAGDVVRVAHEVYGWGPINSNPSNLDKLFRVDQVIEVKSEDGSLGARLSLVEYNNQVYENISIQDYTPATNTGIPNPAWISTPGSPIVTNVTIPTVNGQMGHFTVSATVPATGTVLFLDFYYGTTTDVTTYKLYRTVTPNTGRAFVNGETITISVNDLPAGTYYWSIKARNTTTATTGGGGGGSSQPSPASSNPLIWAGAAMLAPSIISGIIKGGVDSGLIQPDSILTALIKDGAVTAKKIAPGSGLGPLLYIYYDIADQNGVFIDPTTSSIRNQPMNVPPYSGDINPPAQGTSSTADGFNANSTGPYVPNNANFQKFSEGTLGWYKVAKLDLSTNPFNEGDSIYESGMFTITTDTPNTIVQITSYFQSPTYIIEGHDGQILWPQLQSYDITTTSNVVPYPLAYSVSSTVFGASVSNTEIGVVIRCLTPGANVNVCMGTYSTKQNN